MAVSSRALRPDRRTVLAVSLLVAACVAVPDARAQTCTGDCDQDQSISADELGLGIQIALGKASTANCPAFDGDGDGTVRIDEVVSGMSGCGSAAPPLPRAAGTVVIEVGTAIISVGADGFFPVTLDDGGFEVAGIQVDITYDPLTPVAANVDGDPDCLPGTPKDVFTAFRPNNTIRVLVFSFSDVDPIPNGSTLFSCRVSVSPLAPFGTYPLLASNEGSSDPSGFPPPTDATDGAIIVVPPPTPTSTPFPTPTPTPTPAPAGLCSATPRPGCRVPGTSSVNLRSNKLTWKWSNGAATGLADFGQPVTGSTDYSLCVYGSQLGARTLATSATVEGGSMCGGTFCWRPAGLKGFRYRDEQGQGGGITKMRLRVGGAGEAEILVKGGGANLELPEPADLNNLLYQDPDVTVQFVNSDGVCWEAVYLGPARRIDGDQFMDRF